MIVDYVRNSTKRNPFKGQPWLYRSYARLPSKRFVDLAALFDP